jgi:hypothetical protein
MSFFLISAVKMQQTDEMQAIVLVALVYGRQQYDILQADNITALVAAAAADAADILQKEKSNTCIKTQNY